MKWISWFKGLPLGWEPKINQISLLVQVSSLHAVSFKSMEWPFILLLVVGVVVALALTIEMAMVTIIMTAAVMAIISSGVSISASDNGVHASSNNLHGSGSCNGNEHCCINFWYCNRYDNESYHKTIHTGVGSSISCYNGLCDIFL